MPITLAALPAHRVRAAMLALMAAMAVDTASAAAIETNASAASSPADAAQQLLPPLDLPDVGAAAAAAIPAQSAAPHAAPRRAAPVQPMPDAGTDLVDAAPHGGAASAPAAARAASARAGAGQWDDDAIPPELRSMGKAALQWIKGAWPWGRDDDSPETEVNWSNGPQRRSGGAAGVLLDGGGDAAHAGDSSGRGDETRTAYGAPNLLREGIEAAKEVLSHPITWLIVSLCVIGAIAFSLADRRPK